MCYLFKCLFFYQVTLSNDLGETSTEGKLALSGAPQFTEKIEDQKTGIDAPWKIAAKVTGKSRGVSLKFYFGKICPHHVQIRSGGPEYYRQLTFLISRDRETDQRGKQLI